MCFVLKFALSPFSTHYVVQFSKLNTHEAFDIRISFTPVSVPNNHINDIIQEYRCGRYTPNPAAFLPAAKPTGEAHLNLHFTIMESECYHLAIQPFTEYNNSCMEHPRRT